MSTPTIDYDAIANKYGATSSAAPQSSPAPQSASASVDYDAIAQKYGATSSQPAAPAEQPGLIERGADYLQKIHEAGPVELFKGAGKGLGETALGSIDLLKKAEPSYLLGKMGFESAKQEHDQWAQMSGEAHKKLEATNAGQEAGKALEFVGEMMLGDEVFKGLTALEKVEQLHKAGKLLKECPVIGKILQRTITAGASAGTVEGVKTGDPEKALEAAAIGGVTGGLFEGGSAAGQAAFNFGKDATKKIVSSVWDSASGKTIQRSLQSGIRDTLEVTAREAEVATVRNGAQPAIRNSVRSVADSVEAKAKGLYAEIDSATAGRYTNATRELGNVNRKLREVAGVDDALEDKLIAKRAKLESDIEDLLKMAEKEGVSPEVAQAARTSWKKSQALYDLDIQVKASTFGNAKNSPEVVDPSKLVTRLQKLEDSGRLQEALGPEQADALLQKAHDALEAMGSHGKKVKAAKTVGKYVGLPAAGAALGVGGLKALGGD
jgi:hypothetical protein